MQITKDIIPAIPKHISMSGLAYWVTQVLLFVACVYMQTDSGVFICRHYSWQLMKQFWILIWIDNPVSSAVVWRNTVHVRSTNRKYANGFQISNVLCEPHHSCGLLQFSVVINGALQKSLHGGSFKWLICNSTHLTNKKPAECSECSEVASTSHKHRGGCSRLNDAGSAALNYSNYRSIHINTVPKIWPVNIAILNTSNASTQRTAFNAVSWHWFSASELLPVTSSDSELWSGACGTCVAAYSVEVVLNPGQHCLLESSTGQWERQRCSLRQSISFLHTTTPLMYQIEQFNTNVNRWVSRQYTLYLEPFVGFPGRRLLEASPSSLRLNLGGPPSWNERADCSRTGCAGADYRRFLRFVKQAC